MNYKNAFQFLILLSIPLFIIGICSAYQSVPGEIQETHNYPSLSVSTSAWDHLIYLSDTLGSRLSGSHDEEITAEYINEFFESNGYQTVIQPFSFYSDDDEELTSVNVIAEKPGDSERIVIVGAHYDSIGDGDGADDNAASVAIMLEIAERMKDIPTGSTIRFIAFGAEEIDLSGSQFYVDSLSQAELSELVAMINLDSLVAGDILYIYGDEGVSIRDLMIGVADEQGVYYDTLTLRELDSLDGTPCDCADYAPFHDAGVPIAYIEATNWELGDEDGYTQFDLAYGVDGMTRHTKYDTISYIEQIFPGRIEERLQTVSDLLYETLIRV